MSLPNLAREHPWDRQLARWIVAPLVATPVHPNHVSTLGLLIGLAGALMLAQGGAPMAWGAGLFMLAAFMDHADGELARMAGKTSRFGHYYDHFAVGTAYIGMFVGAGFGYSDGWLGPWAAALGLAAGISVTIIFATRIAVETRAGADAVKQSNFAGFEIEDTLYIVGPVTWLGFLEPFLIAAGVGTPLFLLWVLWDWRRQIRGARRRGERA